MLGWTRKIALTGVDPWKIRDDAGAMGTLTHKMIECHCNGDPFNTELAELKEKGSFDDIVVAERGLAEYIEYENQNELKSIASELRGVNEEYQFGFTVDYIAHSNRGIGLLDYKTSKYISADHIIQAAAYTKAVEKEYGIEYTDLVHIRKDFEEEKKGLPVVEAVPIPRELIEEGWEIFKRLREFYDGKKKFDTFFKQFYKKEKE